MKNLTQLIQSAQHTLRLVPSSQRELFVFEMKEHITAIIQSEIERKKLLLMENTKPETDNDWFYGYGYNTAINEDLSYWETITDSKT